MRKKHVNLLLGILFATAAIAIPISAEEAESLPMEIEAPEKPSYSEVELETPGFTEATASVSDDEAIPEDAREALYGDETWISVDGIVGGRIQFSRTTGTILRVENTVTEANIPREIKNTTVRSIGNSAFCYNTNLTSVTLPDTLQTVGMWAFQNCTSLKSITIPYGLTFIDTAAFQNCTSLTSIVFPDSLTMIYGSAFYGCSALKSIKMPASVTTIGGQAFDECTSITSVGPAGGGYDYEYEWKADQIPAGAFCGLTNLTTFVLPQGTTIIPDNAFQYCTSLKSLVIPDGIKRIGHYAFSGIETDQVIIPEGVEYIGNNAFSGISEIKLPKSLKQIGTFFLEKFKHITYAGTIEEFKKLTAVEEISWYFLYLSEGMVVECADGMLDYSVMLSFKDPEGNSIETLRYRNEKFTLPTTFSNSNNYKLLGWAKMPDAAVAEYAPGQEIIAAESTVFYPVYGSGQEDGQIYSVIYSYNLDYDVDVIPPEEALIPVKVKTGETVQISPYVFQRKNAAFAYWLDENTGKHYQPGEAVVIQNSLMLQTVWNITVTFEGQSFFLWDRVTPSGWYRPYASLDMNR